MATRASARPLEQYRKKRDFGRTPEPAGEVASSEGAPRFVVQRHRARNLHYDFRLEIDGVLVSWAVPKGITLDPSARRLAVHVEDHPLEYADFEGVIPRGEYGAGDVIVWDRGTWELHNASDAASALADGELHVELHGEKLRGHVVLVRTRRGTGDREQWLVLHKRDDEAVPGWDPEDHPHSVLSGRDNDDVAADRDRVWTRAGEVGGPVPGAARFAAADDDELAALDAMEDHGTWTVGNRSLRLTHLDQVVFPKRGRAQPVTKRELIRYHAVMAPRMLPYLADRPLDVHRYPDGVDGKGSWQKQVPRHAPDWIERWTNPDADRGEHTEYLVANELATLVWLANHAAVELYPWASRRPDVNLPTYALIDLDRGTASTWNEVLTRARLHRTALDHLGVRGYPKTSGRGGIQIWIPIATGPTFDETRAWVRQVSEAVAEVAGDAVSGRDDAPRAISATLVAPFSVRAAPGAPVSMPITWDDLDDPKLRPDRWELRNAPQHVAQVGDPMARMLTDPQRLVPLK